MMNNENQFNYILKIIQNRKDQHLSLYIDSIKETNNIKIFQSIVKYLNKNRMNDDLKYIISLESFLHTYSTIADTLIIECVKDNNNEIAHFLLQQDDIMYHFKKSYLFYIAIKYKNLEIAKIAKNKYNFYKNEYFSESIKYAFEKYYNKECHYIFEWLWCNELINELKIQDFKLYNMIKSTLLIEEF